MFFAETFKHYRKMAGYTQEDVAKKLLVTPQAVSKWEVGGGTPDISLLVPIADLFGITTDALLNNVRKSREEIADDMERIDSSWNADLSKDENFGAKYKKYVDLLRNNPDSVELLRAILNLSCAWLSSCSQEMSNERKREIVGNAERFSKNLRKNPEDVFSSHCIMCEIYFHGGETDKAEAELVYFSPSGQYIRDRAKYMHLKMEKKYEAALPCIGNSISHTLYWLLWDIQNLAGTYRSLKDQDSMYKIYHLEHDLLQALSCTHGKYFSYYFHATMRLAQEAAQKNDVERCLSYLEEMMGVLRKLRGQNADRASGRCVLFAGNEESQTAKISKEAILEALEWKSFDFIRANPAFEQICKEIHRW